ncbi:PAP_fibrillin [Seminavis robusta]|uniref:PAP_fibrillin n=1 Tax=Seminavis robusta TaxID=568900 RepID=A0A9N8ESI8_9STRA|nr:PAP_fibrillin [Seminavis robusta]|eukprot:Sro1473_g275590.1 PAP_fibrillin (287) ;mRNA; f:6000-7117
MKLSLIAVLVILCQVLPASSFLASPGSSPAVIRFMSEVPSDEESPPIPEASLAGLESVKADLVSLCSKDPKPSLQEVQRMVRELEEVAEQIGAGQGSSISGLLNGEWELLYSPEDETRASPFFWAFSKAYPTNADQIFSITDAIPAPIKEVGPAYQQIEFSASSQTGSFISRVKVATLGGLATSMMTTRGSIIKAEGLDGLRLKIETTKPEESTILQKLGPLGSTINENAPPFPSGEALERVQPGSSEVVMLTTFCDDGIRISRNADKPAETFVWKRSSFASFEPM